MGLLYVNDCRCTGNGAILNPAISLLLPIRDGESFLSSARAQVQATADSNDEILIVDDGSTDSTAQLLKEWAKQDHRIRILTGRGRGLVSALNLGLAEASNEWIARFDVDDHYAANRLDVQREAIRDGMVACFSDYDFFGDNSRRFGTIPSAIFPSAVSVSLCMSQRTAHPSVIYSKSAVSAVGGYRKEDFPAEDLSLWLRLSRVGDLISIPSVLLHYRLGQGSISMTRRVEMQQRTQQLVKELGILSSDIHECLSNWEHLCSLYSAIDLGWQRKILLYRELRMLSNSINLSSEDIKHLGAFKIYLLRHLQTISAFADLSTFTLKRRLYRFSNS